MGKHRFFIPVTQVYYVGKRTWVRLLRGDVVPSKAFQR